MAVEHGMIVNQTTLHVHVRMDGSRGSLHKGSRSVSREGSYDGSKLRVSDHVRRMDSTNSSLDGDKLEFSRMDSRESQTSSGEFVSTIACCIPNW